MVFSDYVKHYEDLSYPLKLTREQAWQGRPYNSLTFIH